MCCFDCISPLAILAKIQAFLLWIYKLCLNLDTLFDIMLTEFDDTNTL